MGNGIRGESGIDIQCLDCHCAELAKKTLNQLKPEESLYAALQPSRFFYSDSAEVTVTLRHGSALYHVRESVSPDEKKRRLLTGKVSGIELEIPFFKPGSHHNLKGHERLDVRQLPCRLGPLVLWMSHRFRCQPKKVGSPFGPENPRPLDRKPMGCGILFTGPRS